MRARIAGVVGAVAAVGVAVTVVAAAGTSANGLPSYTNGYAKWTRINAKPFTSTGPLSSAHPGVKNVYVNKRKAGKRYPNGTVVVKTIVDPGAKFVGKVAVMRKVSGRWQYVEYICERKLARYTVLAQGALCQDCHAQARANDYVFTKK